MSKIILSKPVLLCFYGLPGSGKSYISNHLKDSLHLAHVSADQIRGELFASPRYDAQENSIVTHLMTYMTQEFLNAGVSVAFDINAMRAGQRRALRELARRNKSQYLLVWLQIDPETAYARTQQRDRRTLTDKYAQPQSPASFEKIIANMQSPDGEEYLVISGKHAYVSQKSAVINRLYQLGLVSGDDVQQHVAKPGLVNLVPNPLVPRPDLSRRDISVS